MKVNNQNGKVSITDIQLSEGKVSSTGKSIVLFSEKQKDTDGTAYQLTIYKPTKN